MSPTGIDPLQFSGPVNSQIVRNPDPDHPVIADTQQEQQDFMRLMIEQLKNQDPMNPMESNEFTQQLAALNSLEQLVSISQTLTESTRDTKLGESSMLIGRYVEGLDNTNVAVAGYVERVEVIGGVATLRIGEQTLTLDQVLTVDDLSPEDEQYLLGQYSEPEGGE